MKLFLMQHAQAKSKDEDPERPLSVEGIAEMKTMTDFAAQKAWVSVDQIFCSPKTRAKQTAEMLEKMLKPAAGVTEDESLLAMADPAVWAKRLASEVDNPVMLVGHLPHLSKLTSLLVCGDVETQVVNFHNSGLVCLTADDDQTWAIDWIITPALLLRR